MPQHPYELAGLAVLHMTQPVEGGVARVVTDLAAAQVRAGARVVVACPSGGPLARAVTAVGAEAVRWPARRAPGPGLPVEVTAAARILGDVDPDLLHLHSAKAGLAGRLAAHGTVPTVFQPHAWSYEAARGPVAAAAVRWERHATRWTERVVCVSEAERASGRAHGIRAAWSVIPNGIDTGHFTPAADPAAVRASLPALSGLDPDAPLVVCVGRLCPQKGQDVLLRAWPAVAARLPGARLVLVGDGPDAPRLLAGAPDGVLLAGPVADARPWYQAADVVVQPSRWEGMALAPLEAMACGRPVVLTDVAGARESLPSGDAAHSVVPVDDEPALARALLRLLADPALRRATALRALAHVRDRHDVDTATSAVATLYADLLTLPAPQLGAPR
ncbi:MAG: glycosyltransferase family 4 protein [Actinomycetia bacterium]|nr:glycosyltransferase family 4 protein [Actinomycetes bacterium]